MLAQKKRLRTLDWHARHGLSGYDRPELEARDATPRGRALVPAIGLLVRKPGPIIALVGA